MELENEHLVLKHQEENKKQAEKFSTFVKICKKYLSKIKCVNQLLAKIEQKNIKSILENKNKIYKEVTKIIEEFDLVVNDHVILKDFDDPRIEVLDKLEENNTDDINKIFNFIDHIAKLETANQRLLEQNELLNKKMKNDVLIYLHFFLSLYYSSPNKYLNFDRL